MDKVLAAAVQAAPVFLDRDATIDKARSLVAEVDAATARSARHEFDPVGHFARPDVFRLLVDERPRPATEPAAESPAD